MLIAISGGLASAVCFAVTAVCAARAGEHLAGRQTLAWAAIAGLALLGVPAAVRLAADVPSTGTLAVMALAGTLNAVGLLAEFVALRGGRVSLVMPIVSAEGAIAAVIASATGERLSALAALALALTVVGLLATVLAPRASREEPMKATGRSRGRTIALASSSASVFGLGLYLQGRLGTRLPVELAVLPAPTLGVLLMAVPLAARGRLRLPRAVAPWALGAGVCEVVGFVAYTVGARESIAISSVLSAQFGAVAALLGLVLFGERLAPRQWAGVAGIAVGVALLAVGG